MNKLEVNEEGEEEEDMGAIEDEMNDMNCPSYNKDQTFIVKGKRTKRQRLTLTIAAAAHSSSGGGGGDGDIINTALSRSGSNHDFLDRTTEEDEDTARCLILLAQGRSCHDDHDYDYVVESHASKFNSKRYVETEDGKVGTYVYDCRTCNRTFPSFQALGGHRASHKKPKLVLANEKKPIPTSDDDDDEDLNPVHLKRSKIHECSICGVEFSSGQALGGHMRRHRVTVGSTETSSSYLDDHQFEEDKKKTKNNFLSLDLNLPAPDGEHSREANLDFNPKKQQHQKETAVVLSAAPTLVNCYY